MELLLETFGEAPDVGLVERMKRLDEEIKALEGMLRQADQALIRLRHDILSLQRRAVIR